MICFKSKKYYEHAKILRDHGMSKKNTGTIMLVLILDLQIYKLQSDVFN